MGSIDWRFVDQSQRDAMLAIEEITEAVALDTARHTADTGAVKNQQAPQTPASEKPPTSSGGDQMTPPNHPGWDFFKSPQAYVIGCTLVILVTAAGMYNSLSGKLDTVASSASARSESIRVELKSDIQTLSQRSDVRFDQVTSRFDSLMTKMDADNRELRALILNQRQPQQH